MAAELRVIQFVQESLHSHTDRIVKVVDLIVSVSVLCGCSFAVLLCQTQDQISQNHTVLLYLTR